jgi:hypothetical protein
MSNKKGKLVNWLFVKGTVAAVALLTAAGFVCALPISPSGAEVQAGGAAVQEKDSSKIWGWWQAVPWDNLPVTSSRWAELLNQPIDLARKGQAGDVHRYEIKRTNLTVDRQGRILSRMTAEGSLSRTLLRKTEPGVWTERVVWERFAAAQGLGAGQYPVPVDFPGARGLSFDFAPRTFDYVNAPVDFIKVGDEVSGYLLKVLTMDAAGWDAVILSLHDHFGGRVRIGDTMREVNFEPWDITRVGGEGTVGQYHAGEMQVSVIGLTRFHGEPCLLLWLSMEGNEVTQKMETPQFSMDMKSTEYFRGEIAVSLNDGRLLGMEIWGPLPCTMAMGFGGQPAKEQPLGAIIQQVSLWEVPEGDTVKK